MALLDKDFKVKNGLTVTDSISAGGNLSASDGFFNGDVAIPASSLTVGATSPDSGVKLQVTGHSKFKGDSYHSHFNYGTDQHTYIRGGKAGAEVYINDIGNGDVGIADGGGNVGIGTNSPAARLDVVGGHIRLDAGQSLQWDNTHERIEQSDGHLEFFVNNGEAMTLDTNGLGIGTTAPSQALTVSGNISANEAVIGAQFVKSGGTSSQFLKADGSVDSTSYGTGDITAVVAGSQLTGGATSGSATVNVSLSASGPGAGTYGNNLASCKINTVTLDEFGRVTAVGCGPTGDITQVVAGTNLTGGGTSGCVTLNMATGGAGAGTYGCTDDNIKIDTITLDAYGRVTAVACGNTGDINSVATNSGSLLSGGGGSGSLCIGIDSGALDYLNQSACPGICCQGTTTPGNTQTFTNKSGNISQWTNDSGYLTSASNGTVTSVTAGTGMTQTGTSTINPTLNVIGATNGGICVTADAVCVDSTVVRTTGTQSIGGVKTFTDNVCVSDRIIHTGDSNTCIGFDADQLRLVAGSAEVLRVNTTGFIANEGGDNRDFRVESNNDANALFVDGSKDNVGIGTSSTENNSKLTVTTSDTTALSTLLRVGSTSANQDYTALRFGNTSSTQYGDYGFSLNYEGTQSGNNNRFVWYADNQTGSGGQCIGLSMLQDGSVGIGTASPASKLAVAGNIAVTGTVDGVDVAALATCSGLTKTGTVTCVNTGTGLTGGVITTSGCITLNEATATARGGIELFSNTDQSVAANSVSSTAGRTYGIQLNSDGQAVVNVPWSNTNSGGTVTSVTAGTGMTQSGTSTVNPTLNVIGASGGGICVTADAICVDSTVVRTTGTQTICGSKTFTSDICIAESLTHSGDTDTRVQFGTNTIYAIAGGEEVFRVDNTGMVVNELSYGNDFRVESETDTHALFVDGSADKVGIGTANPSKKLHVAGDGLFTSGLTVQGDLTVTGDFTCLDTTISVTSALSVQNAGTGPALIVNQTGSNDIVDFRDDGTSAFYIEDGGNVGIGITNPTTKLHVSGNALIDPIANGTALTVGRYSGQPNIKAGTDDSGYLIMDSSGGIGAINWYVSDNVVLANGGGSVGIGDSTPSYKLDVNGTLRSVGQASFNAGIELTGNLNAPDNSKIRLGNSADLQIYHDGSNSYIADTSGTGSLIVNTDAFLLKSANNGESMMTAYQDGAVNLMHNNATKFSTTSTGVDVTGTINFAGGASTANLSFGDNDQIQMGTGNDLRIYHDGSHSYVKDSGTGVLKLLGSGVSIQNAAGSENMLVSQENGSVDLYYDGSKKFETTSGGVAVTGGGTFSNSVLIDYTGSDTAGRDAGLRVQNDGNDWGIRIAKDSYANFGLRVDSAGANAIAVNCDGTTNTFSVNGSTGSITTAGDVNVCGGDITLGGTGRIQGIDTVSASTDAANKNYVDTCIAAVPTGDITTVTAGPGLCGGGTSGAVTLCHCDTSSQASVNNSNGTIIQDITLDTYGHVTGIGSCDLDCRYYKQCDIYTQTCINTLLSGKLSTSGCAANSALLDSIDSSQFLRSDTADTASGTINFSGDICVGDQIFHTGDSNTYLQFGTDTFCVYTGGEQHICVNNSGVVLNESGNANDFRVESDTNTHMLFVDGSANNIGINCSTPSATLAVNGSFVATCKSFLVDNPVTGGQLKYGVVEGNEHGVTVRGSTCCGTIDLPAEWDWLVHEDSVTAQITPVGRPHQPYIVSQDNKRVVVCSDGCYNYNIYGTRKDVEPLEVNIL